MFFSSNLQIILLVVIIVTELGNCLAGYLDDIPRCISVITSDDSKNGTFKSENHPQNYPGKVHCKYDFIGRPNERVQIVFTDFNLYHPDGAYLQERHRDRESSISDKSKGQRERDEEKRKERERDCSGEDVDVLSAFVYNEDNKLDRIDDYCGSTTPLAIMSSTNKLSLEFKAPSSSPYVRGFSAMYSFLDDFGIKTGRQSGEYPCRFIYNSSETSNGTITSPNYPGLYPRNTECHYFFHGKDNEHVELHFTYFHIDGVQPCDGDTYSDYVELSNYIPTDRKYDRKCGTIETGLKYRSDRKFFRVNFHSNDRYDATGFQATYQFSDKANHLTIRNIRSFSQTIHNKIYTGFYLIIIVFIMAFYHSI